MTVSSNDYINTDRSIIADAYTSNESAEVLHALCDSIGIRFAGTDGERKGAEYIAGKFKEYGLDRVEIEEFEFSAWRRGESAELTVLGSENRSIPCLALPYGSATPADGVEGEIVDIGPGSAEDIERLGDELRGRIVFTEASGAHRGEIYGRVVKAGAIGFVLTGRTPGMILPTGCVSFGSAGSIPAIGIAFESGQLIKRLAGTTGRITVRIITHDTVEAGISRNVVGQINGTKQPDEYVVIGGHMDSHDVAPGAVDNASGTTCVVETARLLAFQRQSLDRSVRFIAFGAEEVGLLGSYEYVKAHASDMPAIRLMLNLDCLAMSRPKSLVFHNIPEARGYVDKLREQLQEPLPLIERVHHHSDHFPFLLKGVPTAEIGGGQFNPRVNSFGHMAGDTADKVSLMDLREESALAARLLLRASNDPHWPFKTRTEDEVEELLETSGIKKALEYENQPVGG